MTEDYSDLPLARLRWRQATSRIAERYPRAAKDPQLASVLRSLGDSLGAGPEAGEPETAGAGEPDLFRQQVTPDMTVVTDASQCIVAEVTDGAAGKVLRRVTVTDVDALIGALGMALTAQYSALAEAEKHRQAGPDEKRRGEGRLIRREAVEWLTARPMSRQRAVNVAADLQAGAVGGVFTDGMTYDGTYWIVPVQAD